MPKILIVAPSWVGDAVMSQVLFKRLQERHGTSLILDVFAPAWTLPLFHHMPEVHDTIPNPFAHGTLQLGERYRVGKALRSKHYDQVIVLPNSLKSALVPFFARIPVRTGFVGELRWGLLNDARWLDKQALPLMVERFLALAEAKSPLRPPFSKWGTNSLPGETLPPLTKGGWGGFAPHLQADPAESRKTAQKLGIPLDQPVAAFCVGAEYGPAKRWPASHFAELARLLSADGYQIWLIGSAKDAAIGENIQHLSGGLCRNLCGATDLSDAIDLLASASVVVSNDSGLMHIAAALDKPMLALYGSSSPDFTPPLSDKARILSLNLPCSPCFKRECPLGHFNCMNQMLPQQALIALRQLLTPPQ
jgi:heptosyltransferase-2